MKIRLQQLDVPNLNKRTYPKDVMQKAIDKVRDHQTPLLGTIGVPDEPGVPLQSVAFSVSDLRIEDDYLVAEAKILNTPMGAQLEKMLSEPPSVSYRTCGTGNVDENGVISNFAICCINAIPTSTAS